MWEHRSAAVSRVPSSKKKSGDETANVTAAKNKLKATTFKGYDARCSDSGVGNPRFRASSPRTRRARLSARPPPEGVADTTLLSTTIADPAPWSDAFFRVSGVLGKPRCHRGRRRGTGSTVVLYHSDGHTGRLRCIPARSSASFGVSPAACW
eukprot:5418267-Pyramimonas_sp.AAC.1